MDHAADQRRLLAAGMLLGIGLGGFIDGIVLHQLLQVHNMLSATHPTTGVDPGTAIANLEINMFWDGLFHAFTWLATALGIALLWNAVRSREVPLSTRTLLGAMVAGWGVFNLVEGVINHHILHIHHVIEGPNHLPWDIAFLVSGVAMIVIGWAMFERKPEAEHLTSRRGVPAQSR